MPEELTSEVQKKQSESVKTEETSEEKTRTEKMPEIPELVYDSLRQGKYLQHSVDKIARELQSNHVRQGQSRYFLGIGATLVLSGTFLLVSRPEWGLMPGWLMAGGLIAWFVGWRKTR